MKKLSERGTEYRQRCRILLGRKQAVRRCIERHPAGFPGRDSKKAEYLTQENFNGLAAYEEKDETPFRFGAFTTMGELYVETGLSEINMSKLPPHPVIGFGYGCGAIRQGRDTISTEILHLISGQRLWL